MNKRVINIIIVLILAAGTGYYIYTEFQKLLAEQVYDTSTKAVQKSEEVGIPVVRYKREGLLNADDKNKLKQYLIAPYFDYYNESEIKVIALVIEVPQTTEQPYLVDAIYKDMSDGSTPYEGFTFGVHRGAIGYWKPECLNACPFSETFKKKYPEIVK